MVFSDVLKNKQGEDYFLLQHRVISKSKKVFISSNKKTKKKIYIFGIES